MVLCYNAIHYPTSCTILFNHSFQNVNQKQNTIFVFIDASNLWQAQKAKGRFLDYQKIIMGQMPLDPEEFALAP